MTEAESRAVDRLREINHLYAFAHPVQANPNPVGRVASLLGVFAFRQVEAIVTLTEADQGFHLQVAQLVRSLVEAWFQVVWILSPEGHEEKLRRVIGLNADGLRQHRRKLEYHQEHIDPVQPAHWEELETQEATQTDWTDDHGVTPFPSVKSGLEALNEYERYVMYRWDSDAVHASTTGLGGLVQDDVVGGLGEPGEVLARLVTAWHTAGDVYELVARELGFELPAWVETRGAGEDELSGLLLAI